MNELAQLGPRMKNCDVDVNVDSDSDVAIASAVVSYVVSVPELLVVVVSRSQACLGLAARPRRDIVCSGGLPDWRTADNGQRTVDSGWMEASRLHKKRQNFQTKQEITKHATKIAKTNRISEQNRVVGVVYEGGGGRREGLQ